MYGRVDRAHKGGWTLVDAAKFHVRIVVSAVIKMCLEKVLVPVQVRGCACGVLLAG